MSAPPLPIKYWHGNQFNTEKYTNSTKKKNSKEVKNKNNKEVVLAAQRTKLYNPKRYNQHLHFTDVDGTNGSNL